MKLSFLCLHFVCKTSYKLAMPLVLSSLFWYSVDNKKKVLPGEKVRIAEAFSLKN